MTVGRSENGSDDLWIGEMGLSARNGKTVDRRNEGGSEKNEIGVRNVFRKLTVSVDWIGAWIGVDRSDFRNSWSGSELVSFPVWSGLELGSWADRSLDRSGSEWFSSSASSLDRERIGVDRSLAASSRERIGVDRSLAASSLDRGASVWVVPFGSVCGSKQWRLDRGSACVRDSCVWERGGKDLKWK